MRRGMWNCERGSSILGSVPVQDLSRERSAGSWNRSLSQSGSPSVSRRTSALASHRAVIRTSRSDWITGSGTGTGEQRSPQAAGAAFDDVVVHRSQTDLQVARAAVGIGPGDEGNSSPSACRELG
jgi:hypothetical protein